MLEFEYNPETGRFKPLLDKINKASDNLYAAYWSLLGLVHPSNTSGRKYAFRKMLEAMDEAIMKDASQMRTFANTYYEIARAYKN